MKPQLKNGFIITEALYNAKHAPKIDYEELGIPEPTTFEEDDSVWIRTAIRADKIISINDQENDNDPTGNYCRIETAETSWSLRCGMDEILNLI